MHGVPDSDAHDASAALFDFLALVVSDRQRDGLRTLGEYQRRFPGFEADIAVEYDRLVATTTTAARNGDAMPTHIGPYRVLHELGRGGQARVWLALDEKLRRHVAVKVVTGAFGSVSTARRERLRREANAISRLDHAGICAIYDADLDSATPYLSMRYVPGETLAARLVDERQRSAHGAREDTEVSSSLVLRPRGAEQLSAFLRFFEKLARATHAAHEAGLVHRDIKPSNVMVTPTGEPVILDFGLARDESSDEITLTQSDAVVGTPVYMAPEQLGLVRGEPDRRTDVYALGATLYECITLQRPFAGRNIEVIREAIRAGATADPKQLNPSLPADLRVVIATALEREPRQRYASALDLAEDLRRVREYEPILARPPSTLTRAVRWTQRHPTLALLSAVSMLVLIGWIVTERRSARELRAKEHETQKALSAANAANAKLLSAALRERAADAGRSNPLLALLLAREAYAREPSARSSRALLDALQRPTEERLLIAGAGSPSYDGARQGSLIAAGRSTGDIDVWDVEADRHTVHLGVSEAGVLSVDISPDCLLLAYGTEAGESGVLSLGDGGERTRFKKRDSPVLAIEFDSAGERVATGELDGMIRVTNARDGRDLVAFRNGVDAAGFVRWTSNGDRLIAATSNTAFEKYDREGSNDVRVWDAHSGALLRELYGHTAAIRSIECSKDGARVLTSASDGTARLWDAMCGEELWRARAPGTSGSRARFSPSETFVAFAYDPGVQLLDACTGEALHTISNSGERRVMDVDYSPDETRLAAASQDGVVRLFRVSDAECVAEFRSGGKPPFARFCSNGRRVVCIGAGALLVWRCDAHPLPVTLSISQEPRGPAALVRGDLDAQGAFAVTADTEGCVRLWEVDHPDAGATILSRGVSVVCASFDRLGERLAIVRADGSCEISSGSRFSALAAQRAPSATLTCACFNMLGDLVCAGADEGRVWLFDVHSRLAPQALGDLGSAVLRAYVSNDDSLLLAAHANGTVSVWNLATHTRVRTLSAQRALPPTRTANLALGFSPDGTRLAINFGEAERTSIFGTPDMERLAEYKSWVLGAVQFAPKADALVEVCKWRAVIQVTPLDDPDSVTQSSLGSGFFVDSDTSPDGALLATCWSDPVAYVFDIQQREPVLELARHTASVACIRFSRDGKRLITASKDGTAIVWPVNVDEEAERRTPGSRDELLRFFGVSAGDALPAGVMPGARQ